MSEHSRGTVSHRRWLAGFSLAEAMVMLIIVSTAVLGIVGVSVRVGRTVNSSHLRLAATAVASDQLERLVATPYDALSAGTASKDGVTLAWTISDETVGKAIRLAYQYELPRGVRQDTLTAVRLKP